jgi:hypothetical protein
MWKLSELMILAAALLAGRLGKMDFRMLTFRRTLIFDGWPRSPFTYSTITLPGKKESKYVLR